MWTIAAPSITTASTAGASYHGSTIDVNKKIKSDFEHLHMLLCSETETGKL